MLYLSYGKSSKFSFKLFLRTFRFLLITSRVHLGEIANTNLKKLKNCHHISSISNLSLLNLILKRS